MTKWVNPISRKLFHPAWYSILVAIGIVVLLVLTCQGCSFHGHYHAAQSAEPAMTIELPDSGDGG